MQSEQERQEKTLTLRRRRRLFATKSHCNIKRNAHGVTGKEGSTERHLEALPLLAALFRFCCCSETRFDMTEQPPPTPAPPTWTACLLGRLAEIAMAVRALLAQELVLGIRNPV
jgi:hypothetical protein